MIQIQITRHFMPVEAGKPIEYFRILRRCGGKWIGQSLMPFRLTPAQRAMASDG